MTSAAACPARLGGELKQEGEGREELSCWDGAQSPPLCARLGEPLGLRGRRSLASSCPSSAPDPSYSSSQPSPSGNRSFSLALASCSFRQPWCCPPPAALLSL